MRRLARPASHNHAPVAHPGKAESLLSTWAFRKVCGCARPQPFPHPHIRRQRRHRIKHCERQYQLRYQTASATTTPSTIKQLNLAKPTPAYASSSPPLRASFRLHTSNTSHTLRPPTQPHHDPHAPAAASEPSRLLSRASVRASWRMLVARSASSSRTAAISARTRACATREGPSCLDSCSSLSALSCGSHEESGVRSCVSGCRRCAANRGCEGHAYLAVMKQSRALGHARVL
eukprot:365107-Chlamydomonas_euryale.AAC.8